MSCMTNKSLQGTLSDPEGIYGTLGGQQMRGYSAYMIAKLFGGFEGTEQEWLESLKGKPGEPGDMSSALTIVDGKLCCKYREEQDDEQ